MSCELKSKQSLMPDPDANVANPITVASKPKHKRKGHRKVRTGCLTCKFRRKKCDETKPDCIQCVSRGWKCEGYQSPRSSESPQHSASPPQALYCPASFNENEQIVEVDVLDISDGVCDHALHPQLKRRRLNDSLELEPTALSIPQKPNMFPLGNDIRDVDIHCFSYFCEFTGPQFSSYFDCTVLGEFAIKRALAHPVLFSVAAAVGAVHRRFNYGISREAFEYCAHAKNLQAKAIQQLNQLKRLQSCQDLMRKELGTLSAGIDNRDIIMISEIFLAMFAAFQGESKEVVEHTTSGLQSLLKQRLVLLQSKSKFYQYLPELEAIHQLFNRIKTEVKQLLGSSANILATWGCDKQLPPIPSRFVGIEEARDYLFTEFKWIASIPEEIWNDNMRRTEKQDLHVTRILQWNISYAETKRKLSLNVRQRKACILIKLVRWAVNLLLYRTMSPGGSADRNAIRQTLIRGEILASRMVLDSWIWEYEETAVGFDTYLGAEPIGGRSFSEFESPSVQTSKKIRHLLKAMIIPKKMDTRQWENQGVYNIAELICAVEEHAVLEATKDIVSQKKVKPLWLDVTYLLESRKVLLRYCTSHESGLGLVWTQEQWSFD